MGVLWVGKSAKYEMGRSSDPQDREHSNDYRI
jgi:hypothetical protein